MNDQVNVSVCRSALLTNPHPLVALVVLLGLLEKLPLIAESLLVPLTFRSTPQMRENSEFSFTKWSLALLHSRLVVILVDKTTEELNSIET